MIYDEIKVLKQSEKSTVRLVKEQGGERMLIRKTLQGQRGAYEEAVPDDHKGTL